jgi:hypothetical protein
MRFMVRENRKCLMSFTIVVIKLYITKNIRLIFDECTDKSYDIFTNWLSSKRPIFDTILMIDTKNDAKTRESHVMKITIFHIK